MPFSVSPRWFVPIFALVAACGPIQQVENRVEYWSAESNRFFAEPRTMQDVHSWLRSHEIIYTFDDADTVDGNWSMTLEKIYLDGWRCEYVDIKIDITVDGSRQVQDQSLRTDRACWW
jgi:hypothetical protein